MSDQQILSIVAELGATPDQLGTVSNLLSDRLRSSGRSWVPLSTEALLSVDPDVGAASLVHSAMTMMAWEADELDPADSTSPTMRTLGHAALPGRPAAPTPADSDRPYEDLGVLGRGGMGEVRRVRDERLGRTMAMKILKASLVGDPASVARFMAEAQATAQLAHPGIVPVHELGVLADGRQYFTMAEVKGKTLTEVIGEVHAASQADRWLASPSGWSFRRLVDAFCRVCDAVAYAHERGVIHRDIKPDNIMVGRHGEVQVLDWGLAKVRGRRDLAAEQGGLDVVETGRSADESQATRMGSVAGTPAYMPPEQARGQINQIAERSDVYALGAVLYQILTGRPPYVGVTGRQVLKQVLAGPPDPLRAPADQAEEPADPPSGAALAARVARMGRPPVPDELITACEKAMSRAPGRRYAVAGALAQAVRDWLDGARRREQALAVVKSAESLQPELSRLRAEMADLRLQATARLADLETWDPEEKKAAAWDLEDRAEALEQESVLLDLELEQGLYGALRIDDRLVEAHEALSLRHQALHRQAEEARDSQAVAKAEVLLRQHAGVLPPDSEIGGAVAAYLRGTGALCLVTDPPGVEVLLHRYETHNRRLVPRFQRSLGLTPLRQVSLEKGSYLCLLRHPARLETRYPVHIGRQEHWDGVPPGEVDPHPIRLPQLGEIGPGECYVPAGWFWSGGDPEALDSLPRRRLWAPAFTLGRFSVTNGEYLEFLDALVRAGRADEALRFVPRERSGQVGQLGSMIYGRRPDGGFALVPDAEGDLWEPGWPAIYVTWFAARAFADWQRARTGRGWRLAHELEWEKAARGVDGRFFPWGDAFDPSWCYMFESHASRPVPGSVQGFPVDESVYGVRGLAGNVIDWCQDVKASEGPPVEGARVIRPVDPSPDPAGSEAWRMARGGAWLSNAQECRVANRRGGTPTWQDHNLGFRLARSPG